MSILTDHNDPTPTEDVDNNPAITKVVKREPISNSSISTRAGKAKDLGSIQPIVQSSKSSESEPLELLREEMTSLLSQAVPSGEFDSLVELLCQFAESKDLDISGHEPSHQPSDNFTFSGSSSFFTFSGSSSFFTFSGSSSFYIFSGSSSFFYPYTNQTGAQRFHKHAESWCSSN
ncbi:hypothetical protein C8R47DRAFT_1228853 [Mycena vitilis]|nr:hypothetical protein C8R47DRAFT_1228853 [Mycena vitilis]